MKKQSKGQPHLFDPALAAMFACPACHSALHVEGEQMVCGACRRAYPVIAGIPVLIIERAKPAPAI
ncbi:MAG TPA: Trm112 family protein [Terracidiphilus sp.]